MATKNVRFFRNALMGSASYTNSSIPLYRSGGAVKQVFAFRIIFALVLVSILRLRYSHL